jgi:hypothetical protein
MILPFVQFHTRSELSGSEDRDENLCCASRWPGIALTYELGRLHSRSTMQLKQLKQLLESKACLPRGIGRHAGRRVVIGRDR